MDQRKRLLPRQSDFSHYCACWARNHRGWQKMKKLNNKISRKRMKRLTEQETKED